MGVFKKLKDVLFDDIEEEVADNDLELSEEAKEIRRKFEQKSKPKKEPIEEENTITEIKIPKDDEIPERELVKSESTFNFPMDVEEESSDAKESIVFDEDYEFSANKRVKDYTSSIYEDLKREPKNETKKFKATPIISPVYGILDHNYSKDDVIVKTDIGVKGPDLDSVRKKAYGIEEKNPAEETELSNLKTDTKSKAKKAKVEEPEEEIKPLEEVIITEEAVIESETETEIENTQEFTSEETLETDLFKLIDSMYEDKEEEEKE